MAHRKTAGGLKQPGHHIGVHRLKSKSGGLRTISCCAFFFGSWAAGGQ